MTGQITRIKENSEGERITDVMNTNIFNSFLAIIMNRVICIKVITKIMNLQCMPLKRNKSDSIEKIK